MALPTFAPETASISVLSSSKMNTLYAALPLALDPVGGGTWVTAAPSTINGAHTFTFGCPVTISGAITLSGTVANITCGGTVTTNALTISNVANSVALASRSVTRAECVCPQFDQTEWDARADGVVQSVAITGKALVQPITAPHGSVLTNVTVTLQPAGGHGALPAVLPVLGVYKRSLTTGLDTALAAPVTDSSASVAAFQALHTIDSGVLAETIDRTTFRYYATMSNESGANAAVGLVYFGARRATTITRLDEAP
jgi:hypothetical protein